MNDDLKRRWEDLNREAYGQSTPLLEKVFDLARDLMARLEIAESRKKPLDCYGIEYGGRGKHTVEECEIREFTCRKA